MYGYGYGPPAWLVGVALLLAALPTSAVFGLGAAWAFDGLARRSRVACGADHEPGG